VSAFEGRNALDSRQKRENGFPYDLEPLFHPKSVAIIGASANLRGIGGRPIEFLLRYKFSGKIFPVNPKYGEIAGLKCYPTIKDIPEEVDVALIALPAKVVSDIFHQCVEKGVKSAVIFSSGFGEMGGAGAEIQKALGDLARKANFALCGPNCIGVVNLRDRIPLAFTNALYAEQMISGNIGFISQSGALGGSLFAIAQEMGLGFSYWVSSGNEEVLESTDYMHYMVQDSLTQVILGYVEGFRNINKLHLVAREALKKRKPIVILKVGQSEAGRNAAASHTGAMTGPDNLYDALFKQTGILRVGDLDEMFNAGTLLALGRFPEGKGVGILTSSGGAGVLLADKCLEHGLSIPQLVGETKETLVQLLPPFGSALNPVDITGQSEERRFSGEPELLKNYMRVMLKEQNLHSVIIMLTMYVGERAEMAAQDIVEIFRETEKPMVVCWIAGQMAEEGYKILRKAGVPLFKTPGECVRAISALVEYSHSLQTLA
jgi:acetyltransferase